MTHYQLGTAPIRNCVNNTLDDGPVSYQTGQTVLWLDTSKLAAIDDRLMCNEVEV